MNFVLSKGIPAVYSSLKYEVFRNVLLNCKVPFLAGLTCSKTFTQSSICQTWKRSRTEIARYKALDNVDWLPFPWKRPPQFNPFEDSGDYVKEMEYDPSWPKPDFELSEELETACEDVKRIFTLATGSKHEIKEAIKRRWLARIQRHPTDMTSLEVNIALRTLTIRSVFQHMRENKKERRGGRFVLCKAIQKRNRLLKDLRTRDTERFNWLCEELKLYYKPQRLGGIREFWTRKWDLRRLTREYCTKMLKDKKAAYHEELKRQQQEFLKEKEELLAWIEKEEKELANLTIDDK